MPGKPIDGKKGAAPSKSGRRWKWAVQGGVFALFLVLFFLMHHPWRPGVPYRIFFDLDPFTYLAGLAGTRSVWLPVVVFLAVGLLCGRLFCGYICPLGFCIDLADRGLGGGCRSSVNPEAAEAADGGRTGREGDPPVLRRKGPEGLQWAVLTLVLLGCLMHNSLPLVLDPTTLLFRGLAVVLYPIGIWAAGGFLHLFRPVAESLGWYGVAYLSLDPPAFQSAMGSLFLLALVLGLAFHSTRFWCRYVCPLGALLGLLARVAPGRRTVARSCVRCGRCRTVCPSGAIEEDPFSTKRSACIQCRACRHECPVDAISFPLRTPPEATARPLPEPFSRRNFFGAVGLGATFLILTRLDPRVMKRTDRWLRPPGAIPEDDFLAACIRCGACLRICVTHTLQASGLENGWIRWCTPVPDLRFAGCEQNCNLCGNVCPSGAIRSLPLVERQHAKIGTAVLSRERCVAWARDRLCLLCDEACPYNAVVFQTVEGHKRPVVDESRCNGCGMCEAVCPMEGEAAIVVFPHGEVRLKEGSYKDVLTRQRIILTPRKDIPGSYPGAEGVPMTERKGKHHG